MVSPTGVERRQKGRRDDDQEPLARIRTLEETAKRQGKMLGNAVKELKRHVEGCESAAAENKADNATIIKAQGELTKAVAPMAAWHDARLKRAAFWGRLADKATDKIIDRVIWGVLTMLATAIGAAKIAPIVGRLLGP